MIQIGVINRIRMNKVVKAGLVLAEVAVLWVERKSVICRNGSSRTLHRVVNVDKLSTISSRLFWCFILLSDTFLLWVFCFSPVQPEDDRGEYLREYMPRMIPITTMTGPAHRIMASP